jgi:hypothetical protein
MPPTQPTQRIIIRIPASESDADAIRGALISIASNIEVKKLIKLGELAADKERLARALKFLPYA